MAILPASGELPSIVFQTRVNSFYRPFEIKAIPAWCRVCASPEHSDSGVSCQHEKKCVQCGWDEHMKSDTEQCALVRKQRGHKCANCNRANVYTESIHNCTHEATKAMRKRADEKFWDAPSWCLGMDMQAPAPAWPTSCEALSNPHKSASKEQQKPITAKSTSQRTKASKTAPTQRDKERSDKSLQQYQSRKQSLGSGASATQPPTLSENVDNQELEGSRAQFNDNDNDNLDGNVEGNVNDEDLGQGVSQYRSTQSEHPAAKTVYSSANPDSRYYRRKASNAAPEPSSAAPEPSSAASSTSSGPSSSKKRKNAFQHMQERQKELEEAQKADKNELKPKPKSTKRQPQSNKRQKIAEDDDNDYKCSGVVEVSSTLRRSTRTHKNQAQQAGDESSQDEVVVISPEEAGESRRSAPVPESQTQQAGVESPEDEVPGISREGAGKTPPRKAKTPPRKVTRKKAATDQAADGPSGAQSPSGAQGLSESQNLVADDQARNEAPGAQGLLRFGWLRFTFTAKVK